ncbi:MAG: alanine--tRNA ligase [Kiritimatiellae bacterium]|nr:alanine--tRNA ligase [Kiritimatiellia bacterium]
MSSPKSSACIRQEFLDFFKAKSHEIVPSSPLVLPADPTLLFANAGMNQFKDIFLGSRESACKRAADTQKCIRVSGKHNDLEEVGLDTYHHTFFEMLGNWSFGDYYKREAIAWAWELLTGVWALPRERLWATVYKDDDEADALWREVTDIDPGHILRFDEKDNFWEMGETGPCGPCTEIHFDRTPDGCGPDRVNANDPGVVEVWNLVFIQFNRRSDGRLEELTAKHVDTGMGLERIVAVLQGKSSNYDTDLFTPLLAAIERASGRSYGQGEDAVAMRVIADHIRALSFAIADGVLPSNEGRGYVLRRLLRRAVRYGRKLGMTQPFIHTLVPVLETIMAPAFPELARHRESVVRAIRAEEENFAATIDRGIALFEEVAGQVRKRKETVFPAADAFKLYDTFGFPPDLTLLMAGEQGMSVDKARFDALMEQQKARARGAQKGRLAGADDDLVADLIRQGLKTEFVGYDRSEAEAPVIAVLRKRTDSGPGAYEPAEQLAADEEGALVLAATPFYAERGGQVGDTGTMEAESGRFDVSDTQAPAEGLVFHIGRAARGVLRKGAVVRAVVDAARRGRIARHHSATHLLQNALREIVSASIKQAGSLVAPDRLRFDFSYYEAIPADRLRGVERRVNEHILQNAPVRHSTTTLKEVSGSDIIALFDEKYGDTVRVVDIGGFSRELCGGVHVGSTGELGVFRILSESSIAAGVRRIEAVCGLPAYELMCRERDILGGLAQRFSASAEELSERVDSLLDENKRLGRALERQMTSKALGQAEQILEQSQNVSGIRLVAAVVGDQSMNAMRALLDSLREKVDSGVVVLGSAANNKAAFVAAVSDDLVDRAIHAGKLIDQVAKVADGGGGGQPSRAQAGGKRPDKVDEAIAKVPEILRQMLG